MHFDDGSNPWMQTENYIKVFHYGNGYGNGNDNTIVTFPLLLTGLVVFLTGLDFIHI